MLCEHVSYTYRFSIYTGNATLTAGNEDLSVSEKTVDNLIRPLLNKGCHLYIDNCYTSIPLFQYSRDNNTMACGTIKENLKGFPVKVSGVKLSQRGEVIAFRSDDLLALKFKDTRPVHVLTTIHDETLQNVNNRRNPANPQKKPKCIIEYNEYMWGVDQNAFQNCLKDSKVLQEIGSSPDAASYSQ